MDPSALTRALLDDGSLRVRGILGPDEHRKFNPDEPRIPSGPHGGEWGHGGFLKKALKRLSKSTPSKGADSPRVQGRDLLADGGLDLSKIASAGDEHGWGPHGDERLRLIAHAQGFDGPPQVVDRQEMDRITSRKGTVVLHRGIADTADVPGSQRAEELRTGGAYFGAGMFGNGIYAATNESAAKDYARKGWRADKSYGPGTVTRMALRPDARIVDYADLVERHDRFLHGASAGSERMKAFVDIGRYAAALGYDAIRLRNTASARGDQFNVLNRTVLIVEGP